MTAEKLIESIAAAFARTDPASEPRTSPINMKKLAQWKADRCYVADALGFPLGIEHRSDFYRKCEANRHTYEEVT